MLNLDSFQHGKKEQFSFSVFAVSMNVIKFSLQLVPANGLLTLTLLSQLET